MAASKTPTFLEFFAGGGFARVGLMGMFDCIYANDFDPAKAEVYQNNFGQDHFDGRNVWDVSASDVPQADLAWASFPCQDLSLAGDRKGLYAPRSGAFWGFWNVIEEMINSDRGPRTVVLENVVGLISSRRGRDFSILADTVAGYGYRLGAMVIDARWFVPQSRPRLFIVAHKGRIPGTLSGGPDARFHPPNLDAAVGKMQPATQMAWTWWKLSVPERRTTSLEDILERTPDSSVWRSDLETQRLISQMTPSHQAKWRLALDEKRWRAGAVYRRIRQEDGERVQRAEIRYDGLAGCLRTPGGGSSTQFVLVTENGHSQMRPILAREAARLMGVPENYRLPKRQTPALKVLGDGVCVDAVRWLGEHLLKPLSNATQQSGQGQERSDAA